MGITTKCPDCGKAIVSPDSAAGSNGVCADCGATFTVARAPAVGVQKVCRGCGMDVAGVKRVKDPRGDYYCHPCWEARARKATQRAAPAMAASAGVGLARSAASTASPSANPFDEGPAIGFQDDPPSFPPPSAAVLGTAPARQSAAPPSPPVTEAFTCWRCFGSFAVNDVYEEGDGRTICKACHADSAPIDIVPDPYAAPRMGPPPMPGYGAPPAGAAPLYSPNAYGQAMVGYGAQVPGLPLPPTFPQTPAKRKKAAKYKPATSGRGSDGGIDTGGGTGQLLWGLLLLVGGIVATVVSYNSPDANGKTVFFPGLIVWGIIHICRGLASG